MKKFLSLLTALVISCIILTGCGAKVEFRNAAVSERAKEISLIISADELPLLDRLERLQSADFSGSDCYEELMLWQENHPDVAVRYTVNLSDSLSVDNTEAAIQIPEGAFSDDALKSTAGNVKYLPSLQTVSFASDKESEILNVISAFSSVRPDLKFEYEPVISGKVLDYSAETLSFEDLSDRDANKLALVLTAMPNLKSVELGNQESNPDLSFKGIANLVAARPDVNYDYEFTYGGRDFTLMDETLDLSHIRMDDEGKWVREVIPCMPRLNYLDMDSCGVSDEAMASIRDDFPDVKVVWRIWFGNNYSARTDVEKILASKPSVGGCLTPDTVQSLKYCTDVKYLDLGHNPDMRDISFLAYMPKLEVLLIPMGFWDDCSVLENCPNIEYLEIQTSNCHDISPLRNMKKLKHLNICYLPELTDISPIYGCTELERLWIGCITPIPQEQIDKFREICPDCEINTTTVDPTEGGWRYLEREKYGTDNLHPRYKELREMFQYGKGDYAYNFVWNDPRAHYVF